MKPSRLPTLILATSAFALFVLMPNAAAAADDFQVNDTSQGNQDNQDVAMDDAGGFLIVWASSPTWPTSTVLGKRYDADGNALGGKYRIPDVVDGEQQQSPRLCHRSGGGWAIVWYNVPVYPSPPIQPVFREGVFARFLAEDGTPAGAAFQVSSPIPSYQGGTDLDIACLPGGGFFAAWGSSDQDGSYYGIFGQYVDGAGNLVGTEIQVNTDTAGDQGNFGGVRVASSPAGKVLVMWSSNCPLFVSGPACPVEPDGSGSSAQARLFDESRNPTGSEFRVNTTTLGTQGSYGLDAAFAADESFMIVFTSGDVDIALCNDSEPCTDLLAQRYDSTGAPVGGEILVNSFIPGAQVHSDVASDGNGGYLVVWEHNPPWSDDGVAALAGRHFGPDGIPSGSDFLVTSNAPRDDREPRVASRGGNYVVAWTNYDRGRGWDRKVFARRLASNLPVCPAIPDGDCTHADDSAISMRTSRTNQSKLTWKWSAGHRTASLAPNGGLTGYSLCIYDGAGTLVATTTAVPFADCHGDCWRGRNGRYRFKKKKNGAAFQVRTLSVDNGSARTKIRLRASGTGAPMSPMHDMSAPLTAQLLTSDGECWQADYGQVSRRAQSLAAHAP